MRTWIKQQLAALDGIGEFSPTVADDLRDIIAEAERKAAAAGNPAAVRACQIRPGGIGIGTARRVLAACLAAYKTACETPEPRPMLTPPQLAKEWGVSPDKVLGWVRAGKLQAKNISRGSRPRYLIARADAEAFTPGIVPEPPRERRPKVYRKPEDPDFIEYF